MSGGGSGKGFWLARAALAWQLTTVEAVLNFARSLEFKGKHPVVRLITQTDETGIKLTHQAMAKLEKQFQRLPGLDKWMVGWLRFQLIPDILPDNFFLGLLQE